MEQYFTLHVENLLFSVGGVTDVDQVGDFGYLVSFLVFGCYPERSDSHELELVSVDHISTEVRVNNVGTDEKSLRVQFVFKVHVYEPVH